MNGDYVSDIRLFVEHWRGTLAVPMGSVPAGAELVAHVGAVYTIAADGRITRQSSYDCYEPFPG